MKVSEKLKKYKKLRKELIKHVKTLPNYGEGCGCKKSNEYITIKYVPFCIKCGGYYDTHSLQEKNTPSNKIEEIDAELNNIKNDYNLSKKEFIHTLFGWIDYELDKFGKVEKKLKEVIDL